jgi:Flp pilus assembly protein TadD
MSKGGHHHGHKPKPVQQAPTARLWPPHLAIIPAALALGVMALFWPLLRCDFINYDDPAAAAANYHVQAGLTWSNLAWAFGTSNLANWEPMTLISMMLDVSLFGIGPRGPHFVNIAIHAANTALLFLALRQMTGALWRSAAVAAFFAVHPLHVESVAWVAERKDVLSTFFGLLALIAYAGYARSAGGSKRRWLYGAALGGFMLSLMSKPMLVTLPFLMLLLDWWPLERTCGPQAAGDDRGRLNQWRRLVAEKTPFFILSAIMCVVTMKVQKYEGALSMLPDVSWRRRLANALVSYARYLGMTFWPTRLTVPYPYPGHWPLEYVAGAALLVGGLSVLVLWQARTHRYVVTGWFWFLGMLVPVIGLVQAGIQSLADRYTYLPVVGIFVILAWGAADAAARFNLSKAGVGIATAALLAACVLQTRAQFRYWQNSETLFRHALDVTTDNVVAYENLAAYLTSQGQTEEAMADYRKALEIDPNRVNSLMNLGSALMAKGDFAGAIQLYEQALSVNPGLASGYNNLGYALANLGRKYDAMDQYRLALLIDPTMTSAHYNLGLALENDGNIPEAMVCFSNVLKLNPRHAPSLYNLGLELARSGRRAEGRAEIEQALQLKPDFPEARQVLSEIDALDQQR